MLKKTEFEKYPLDQVLKRAGELLVESEYLVERLELSQSKDYQKLHMIGEWNPEYGSAIIKVIFTCDKKQARDIKHLLEDEDKFDDFDSGVGEAFEEALTQIYPKKKFGPCVGGVEWAVEIVTKK